MPILAIFENLQLAFKKCYQTDQFSLKKKIVENAKNGQFDEILKTLKSRGHTTALPERSILSGQKLVENAKMEKLKRDIQSSFQTMWTYWLSLIVGPDWTRRSRMTSPEEKVNKTNKMVSFMVLTQMRTDG